MTAKTPAQRKQAERKRLRSKDLQRVELKLPGDVVATLDRIGSDRSATVAKLIQMEGDRDAHSPTR